MTVSSATKMLLCCLVILPVGRAALATDGRSVEAKLAEFLEIARELRHRYHVPGVGLGIVVDNQPIYVGGLGWRDASQQLPVTEHTLFGICSLTKSFTGLVVTRLVAKGKLDWHEPIKTYLPDLDLSDDYAQQHITLADACSHMTGLARHDDLWKNGPVTRDEVLQQLKQLPFETSLRKRFIYNNHMFVLVGRVIEQVTGKSWDTCVRDEIFTPLGMEDSYTSHAEFLSHAERALDYSMGGQVLQPPINVDPAGPAGGVACTPADFMRWLRLWVGNGKLGDRVVLQPHELQAYRRPQSASMVSEREFKSYWAGWGLKIFDGQVEYRHSGGIDGRNATIRARPADGFGVFVLTNQVSDYKDLLCDYADQIFTGQNFQRDRARENALALTADFRRFAVTLLDVGLKPAEKLATRLDLTQLEGEMNALGYELLEQKAYRRALAVFTRNVEAHPKSPNAWDSLGECYLLMEEFEKAQDAYGKCLNLDANQENARRMIRRIQDTLSPTGGGAAGGMPKVETDLQAALRQAATEDKFVFAEFHGRPWCPPCMAQQKNLIERDAFRKWISKHAVLVEIRVGEGYAPDDGHSEWAKLFKKFGLQGIPIMVVLDQQGQQLGQLTPEKDCQDWLDKADELLRRHQPTD